MERKKNMVIAKANIIKNQTEEDYFIVNADEEEVMDIAAKVKAQKIIPFSTTRELEMVLLLKDGWIYFNGEKIMKIEDIVLPGKHNLENILALLLQQNCQVLPMKRLKKC